MDYDANGNMSYKLLGNGDEYEYSYDYKNRLVQVVKSGETMTLEYDALGRRTKKTHFDNSYELYYYAGQNLLQTEKFDNSDTHTETLNYIN